MQVKQLDAAQEFALFDELIWAQEGLQRLGRCNLAQKHGTISGAALTCKCQVATSRLDTFTNTHACSGLLTQMLCVPFLE